ncbi:MAG: hypothetical protein ACTSYC_10240 [Promethearchaeota archaeon]
MNEKSNTEHQYFYEGIVKKTKTGSITIPKEIREELFEKDTEIYFKLLIPLDKKILILHVLSEEEAKEFLKKNKKLKSEKKIRQTKKKKKAISRNKKEKLEPAWSTYFTYDFENQVKVKAILESAFYKFAEEPPNLEDAMGRIKYVLVSYLTSIKTENAKLYFAVEKFLLDVIEKFNLPNLLDWIFEKLIPNIESKFLYELGLLELIECSMKFERWEKVELYIFYVLKNIDSYSPSESYNIINSFKQLIKKVKWVKRTEKIDVLLKEKLLEYGQKVFDDIDYKIQIVELLEDLNYIELAYKLAKEIQLSLPQDSLRVEFVRKLVKRLHVTPITEKKQVF